MTSILKKDEAAAYKLPAQSHVSISLEVVKEGVGSDKVNPAPFKPEFCHQHFGEKEEIFGYKEPELKIRYSAATLDVFLAFSHQGLVSDKIKDLDADDVVGKVREHIHWPVLSNQEDFEKALETQASFTPPGTLIHQYSRSQEGEERTFQTYLCENGEEYVKRVQSFALWFIDAAWYIDQDDDRWHFYLTFEKLRVEGRDRFCFVGYVAVYHYYAYPEHIRPRIGQMLVLPPFRRGGHGVELLLSLYKQLVPDTKVIDITVEDPSEHFVAMKDAIDAGNCATLASFAPEHLTAGFSKKMAEEAHQRLKLDRAQIRRCYEILRLKAIDTADPDEMKAFRLAVKQRLNIPFQRTKREQAKVEAALKKEQDRALALLGMDNNSVDEDDQSPSSSKGGSKTDEERMAFLQGEFQELLDSYTRTLNRLVTHPLPAPPTTNGLHA